MAKEDISLRVEMGKLEIEPSKVNKNVKYINLQQQKKINSMKSLQNYKCACISQKKNKNVTICKKKHRILKEPILKLPQSYNRNDYHCSKNDVTLSDRTQMLSSDSLSLHALVDNCNQLSISTDDHATNKSTQTNDNVQWWRSNLTLDKQNKVSLEKGQSSSCSQQALNPPCDVTIDELASYFETLVHIPKKMSSMAEMMYI